jgi:hypothetical protein
MCAAHRALIRAPRMIVQGASVNGRTAAVAGRWPPRYPGGPPAGPAVGGAAARRPAGLTGDTSRASRPVWPLAHLPSEAPPGLWATRGRPPAPARYTCHPRSACTPPACHSPGQEARPLDPVEHGADREGIVQGPGRLRTHRQRGHGDARRHGRRHPGHAAWPDRHGERGVRRTPAMSRPASVAPPSPAP